MSQPPAPIQPSVNPGFLNKFVNDGLIGGGQISTNVLPSASAVAPGTWGYDSVVGPIYAFGANWQAIASGQFSPQLLTTAGINAAVQAASAAGGGLVYLPAQTIQLTGPIIGMPGVTLMGAGYWTTPVSGLTVLGGGTILQGNGTFDAIDYNNVDSLTPYATNSALHAALLNGFNVLNMAFNNFQYAIKIGALYQSGAEHSLFSGLYASNCTQWGFWFENFSSSEFYDIRAIGNFQGSAYMASSGGIYNYGNSTIRRPFGGGNTAQGCGRGVLIQARGGSQMNNINVYDAAGSSATTTSTQAATMQAPVACTITNGQSSIAVVNTCVAGEIVEFSAAVGTGANGVSTNTNYFVLAAGLSTSAIQVATTAGGTPISFNASGTPNVNFSKIGITDMSQVGVGIPVHFSSATNGLQTNITYFVLATSGNVTGAGWIAIANQLGGNTGTSGIARTSTGAGAVNAIFNGWPGIEVGGADAVSLISYASITGNMDLEINLSPHFVCQGVQGGKFEFGITHTAAALNDIVVVGSTNITLALQQSGLTIYLDALSQTQTMVLGALPTSAGGTGQTGYGIKVGSASASLNLSCNNANGGDDIICMPTLKQLQLQNALAMQHTQIAASTTIATSNGNVMTYTGGTGGVNLPNLSSVNFVGWDVFVSNPGAGTLTVTATQNIIGQGASGTTSSIPTLTNAHFKSHNNAGTMYWARYD